MVYQLRQPLDHAKVREGALQVPSLESEAIEPVGQPYLVWGRGLRPGATLANGTRLVEWSFHNAGGAPCQLASLSTDVAWLQVERSATQIEPDGLPHRLLLRLLPVSGLPPGDHRAEVVLRFAWPGGEQELRGSFTLHVPAAAIPWFEEAVLPFTGYYPQRWVSFHTEERLQLLYGAELIATCDSGRRLSLFPAEYRLEGRKGSPAIVQTDGERPLPLEVPCTFRVPGPRLRTQLRNLGSQPLYGHWVSAVPWLVLDQEEVDLAPGAACTISVELQDDGRDWHQETGEIWLRSPASGEVLAVLRVQRDLTVPGARPLVTNLPLQLPAIPAGSASAGPLAVTNLGDQPLEIQSEFAARAVTILPGESAEVPVAVGPPHTLQVRRIEGELALRTNGPLPYWRYLRVPYTLDVVGVSLVQSEIDFETVRYQEQRMKVLQIKRSDHRRGRYVIDFPPALQDLFRLSGDLLFMRNMTPSPLVVDEELAVKDEALGGVVIGQLRVKGHCLVPKLGVIIPELSLTPGESCTVSVTIQDLGGGLDLKAVTSNQPWATVHHRGDWVSVTITTDRGDRGQKRATLTFASNDFVNPVQEHELLLLLVPTLRMRIGDLIWRVVGPIWRPIGRLISAIRSRR